MNKQRWLLITIVLCLVFSIPFKVKAATFQFDPSSATYSQTCSNTVDILMDTQGISSNSADIIVNYDPSKIEILDNDLIKSGIQIQPGIIYENYFGNQVDTGIGVIRLTGATFINGFNGIGIFASINFKSKPFATSTNFDIYMTGVGPEVSLDSNIVDTNTSNDILSGVTNAHYTFVTESCIPDVIPPTIAYITPQDGQTGVIPTSDIQLNIQDSDSGINLSEIKVNINGVLYDINDNRFSYTGSESNYVITIDPRDDFPTGKLSIISVTAKDKAGNLNKSSITFNTPETSEDTEAPVVTFLRPKNGDTIGLTDQISVRILDKDGDVDIQLVEITLNGITYTIDDPEFTYLEDAGGYIIYIQSLSPLPENKASTLSVFSQDTLGNTTIQSITFNIPEIISTENDETNTITKVISQVRVFVTNTTEVTSKFINDSKEITVAAAVASIAVVAPTVIVGTTVAVVELPLLIQRFIFGILGFLGIRKKGRKFGYVYDSITKAPLSLAIIRFYNKVGQLIQTEVTSSYGQFSSNLDKGEYKLVVSKSGYKFPSKVILGTTDGPIANIYHGEFSNFSNEDISSLSIPLDPRTISIKANIYKFKKALLFIWNTISFLLFTIGLIQSIMHLMNSLTTINIIIFFIYLILLLLLILKINPFKQNRGIIYKNKRKKSGIKIILKKLGEDKILDHRVTDKNGKYNFIVTHGSYKIELADTKFYKATKGNTFVYKGDKPTVFGRKIEIY